MYRSTYIRNKNCHQHSYGFENLMSSWGCGSKFPNLQQVGEFSILGSKSVTFFFFFFFFGVSKFYVHFSFYFFFGVSILFIFSLGFQNFIFIFVLKVHLFISLVGGRRFFAKSWKNTNFFSFWFSVHSAVIVQT